MASVFKILVSTQMRADAMVMQAAAFSPPMFDNESRKRPVKKAMNKKANLFSAKGSVKRNKM